MGAAFQLDFVVGGARSGKSRYATQLAKESDWPVCYMATCRTRHLDDEMQARIKRHQLDRPGDWPTIEDRFDISAVAAEHPEYVLYLDCLTLWLSDRLEKLSSVDEVLDVLEKELNALKEVNAQCIFVSNELGMSLVPEYPESRAYRDLVGWANQLCAKYATSVYSVTVGIPSKIK